jgi:hypothetical protein
MIASGVARIPTPARAHTRCVAAGLSDVGLRFTKRLSNVGPWFSKTRFGKTNGRVNDIIVIAILLLCLWKSFF